MRTLIDSIETTLVSALPQHEMSWDETYKARGSLEHYVRQLSSPTLLNSALPVYVDSNGQQMDLAWEGAPDAMLDRVRDKIEDIARTLPRRLIPLDSICTSLQSGSGETEEPMFDITLLHAVLLECQTLNRTIETVHASLRRIDMALLRNSILGGNKSLALSVAQSLIAGKVPIEWTGHSYPTPKPLASWLKDLADTRLTQVTLSCLD